MKKHAAGKPEIFSACGLLRPDLSPMPAGIKCKLHKIQKKQELPTMDIIEILSCAAEERMNLTNAGPH
jgi:hypothetical protein